MEWAKEIDKTISTMLVLSGVLQYFPAERVVMFITKCSETFRDVEVVFDAVSESGLKFANRFVKRTGNTGVILRFGIDDAGKFAETCGAILLEERAFFPDALKILGKKLRFSTRLYMKVVDRKKRLSVLRLGFSRNAEQTS